MRIAIGTIQNVIGGPRAYALGMINALLKRDARNEYYIFSDSNEKIGNIGNANHIYLPLRSPYLRPLWDNITLPKNIKKYGIDIYHDMKNDTPLFSNAKCISTVFDLSPLLFPETFVFLQRQYLKYQLNRALKNAAKIIVPSENTKKDLIRLLNIPAENISIVYCGIDEKYRPIANNAKLDEIRLKYGINGSNILFVGTLQPRKNVDILVKAFKKLKNKFNIPHKLIISGRKGWYYKKLEKYLNNARDIIVTGIVSDVDMPYIYNLADIFVSPSSYEGFGLTIIEAMACGVPVISNDCSSIPEVTGGAGMLINCLSEEKLSEGIYRLISDNSLKKSMKARGIEKAKQYSWDKAAEKLIGIYEEVYSA